MELVEVYEAPESHVGMVEKLLQDAGIPYERRPGVAGYPIIEPFVRLHVPADRAEEAKNLINLGPAMPPPPPIEERELGFTPEMEHPLAIAVAAPEEAMALAEAYLSAHPEDVNAWECAATITSIASDAAAAETLLRRGLEANRDHPWLRAQLGHYLEIQGRLPEAKEIYEGLISTHPDAPHGYAGLASAAVRKNLLDEARRYAQQAADRLHPVYQLQTGLNIAMVWLEVGEQARALEILQTHVNWYRKGGVALMVAVLLETDPDQPDDVVDEAFDDARRLWDTDRDGDWEEVLENMRRGMEEQNFFKKFD